MMTYTERREVQVIAEDLIEEHINGPLRMGYLEDILPAIEWTFAWNKKRSNYGTCHPMDHKITLSLHGNAGRDLEEVKQTILHEIAHALTPRHGHDSTWKAKARELGVRNPKSRAKFIGDVSRRPQYKWVLAHVETGKIYTGRHRLARNKQNRVLPGTWLPGKKRETEGKLIFLTQNSYILKFNRMPEMPC